MSSETRVRGKRATMGTCPICLEEYPMATLPQHAEICASRRFDPDPITYDDSEDEMYRRPPKKFASPPSRRMEKKVKPVLTLPAPHTAPGNNNQPVRIENYTIIPLTTTNEDNENIKKNEVLANTIPLKTVSEATNTFQEESIYTYTNQCRTEIAKLLHSFSNNKYKLSEIHCFVDDVYYNTRTIPKFLYIFYNILTYKMEGIPDTSISIFLGYLFQYQNYYLNQLENMLDMDLNKYKNNYNKNIEEKNNEINNSEDNNVIETQLSDNIESVKDSLSLSLESDNNHNNIENNSNYNNEKDFTFNFDELTQIIENIQKIIPTEYANPISEGIWNILMNKIQHTYNKEKLDEFLMNLEKLSKCDDDKEYDSILSTIKSTVGDSIYEELCKLFIFQSDKEY